MTTVLNGLLGGLLAGLIASLLVTLVPVDREAVSTAGAESAVSRIRRVFVGTGYGSVAGGVFVSLELSVLNLLSVPPSLALSMAAGLLWAGALFLFVVLLEVTIGSDARGFDVPLVYHVVFGVAFGLWIRLTWIT